MAPGVPSGDGVVRRATPFAGLVLDFTAVAPLSQAEAVRQLVPLGEDFSRLYILDVHHNSLAGGLPTVLTRIFKSGNSMAVRIPKELAFVDPAKDVQIERVGDTLVLRPAKRETLDDLPAILAAFSSDFMAQGRELNEQKERDWSGWFPQPEAGAELSSKPTSAA